MNPTWQLKHWGCRYRGGAGLGPIEWEAPAGETLVILGPTGAGKSTWLRTLAGLEPAVGEWWVNGEAWHRRAASERSVAWVPQKPMLYPDRVVAEQLAMVRPAAGHSAAMPHEPLAPPPSLDELARLFHLTPLWQRKPETLSGGELQRVVLAKLFRRQAQFWLLDEPFASLDPISREEFRADLHLLRERSRATIVLVSHDPRDAFCLADRIVLLHHGRILSKGSPWQLGREPPDPLTARWLGWATCSVQVVTGPAGPGDRLLLTVYPGRGHRGDPPRDRFDLRARSPERLPSPEPLQETLQGTMRGWWPGARWAHVMNSLSHRADNLTLGFRPEDLQCVNPTEAQSLIEHQPGLLLEGWRILFSEPVGSGSRITFSDGVTRLQGVFPSQAPHRSVSAITPDWRSLPAAASRLESSLTAWLPAAAVQWWVDPEAADASDQATLRPKP